MTVLEACVPDVKHIDYEYKSVWTCVLRHLASEYRAVGHDHDRRLLGIWP